MAEWWEGLFDFGEQDKDILDPADFSLTDGGATPTFNASDFAGDLGGTTLQGGNFPISSGIDFNPQTAGEPQSVWDRLGNLFNASPDTKKLIGQLAPSLIGGGTALASGLLGSQLGSSAARDIQRQTQRIAQPSPQEQRIMDVGEENLQATRPETRTVGAISRDLTGVLEPYIVNLIQKEGRGRRKLGEELAGSGMAFGGVLPQQQAYLQGETNRQIAEIISKAVQGERELRTREGLGYQSTVGGQAGEQQRQRQNVLMQGQGQAAQAAQAAGRVPMDSAALAAMIAQILGGGQQQAPGYRG
jgi:hypothetical protein